jgi:hypothetical protein
MSGPLKIALVLAVLLGVVAEGAVTWLLVVHVPWLGWPLTALSLAGLGWALHSRSKRRARSPKA